MNQPIQPMINLANSAAPQIYVPGAILEYSWGYDQTNIDYYKVLKRTGQFVTVVEVGKVKTQSPQNFMVGTCVPQPDNVIGKPFRRKVHVHQGVETGISIESYGWCKLWDGEPSSWSAYA
jgi:hypothetical protein